MNPQDLQPHQLMQRLADFFEQNSISYRVVGSMASMAYGEPRLTIDIDIVADLRIEHVPLLVQFFSSPEYYVSETAMRDAIARRFQFNVIHPASGLKADIFIPKPTDYAALEAQRVRRLSNPGEYDAWFSSAEDVVLNKLVYFQLSGGVSDEHIRDIVGIMKLQGNKIDRRYIDAWANKLGVSAEWKLILERI